MYGICLVVSGRFRMVLTVLWSNNIKLEQLIASFNQFHQPTGDFSLSLGGLLAFFTMAILTRQLSKANLCISCILCFFLPILRILQVLCILCLWRVVKNEHMGKTGFGDLPAS